MSIIFTRPGASGKDTRTRGAAPVGYLDELPPIEGAAIRYLRVWCEGGAARERVANDFSALLPPDDAMAAEADFDALMCCLLHNGRRPLMRHSSDCQCFGGDESAFANMIAAAVLGDREDAMIFAAPLTRGATAFEAVRLAESLASVFLQLQKLALSVDLDGVFDRVGPARH